VPTPPRRPHRGEYSITGHPTLLGPLGQHDQHDTAAGSGLVFTTARGLRIGGPPAVPAAAVDPADAALEPRTPVTDPYRGPTGERLEGGWLDLPPNRPALTVVRDSRPEAEPHADLESDADRESDADVEPDPDLDSEPDVDSGPSRGPAAPGQPWLVWSEFDEWGV
jgi:hypothetical protein